MIVLIGMAVGVDYSLFYLKREREERAKGHTHPRRRRDRRRRPRATRSWSPARAVIASMAGLFIDRRRDLQLARHRRDHRRRGRRARLDHRAARAAGQARPLGRPARGSRCCGGSTAGSGAAASAAASWRPVVRHPVVALRRSPRSSWSLLAVPALGMKIHERQPRDPARRRSPRCRRCTRIAEEFPAEGTTATVVVHGAAGRAGRGRARRCAELEATRPPTAAASPAGPDAGRGLGRRHDRRVLDPGRSRSTSPTDRSTQAVRAAARPTWCPAALGDLHGRARRRR